MLVFGELLTYQQVYQQFFFKKRRKTAMLSQNQVKLSTKAVDNLFSMAVLKPIKQDLNFLFFFVAKHPKAVAQKVYSERKRRCQNLAEQNRNIAF